MKKLNCLITVFLYVFLSVQGRGQGYIEGMNTSYEFSPLRTRDSNPEDNKAGDSFTGHTYRMTMGVPKFLVSNKSQYLIFGGTIEGMHFTGNHPSFSVRNVWGIQPMIGYSRHFSKKFMMRAVFMPFLNSDFSDFKSGDIRFGGIVYGAREIKPGLSLRATLGYRHQFYGPQIIALIGLDWKVNERWRVFGDAPRDLTINYQISKKYSAGFNLDAVNTSYKLKNNQYLAHGTAQPGLYFESYISSSFALRFTASYSFVRNEEIQNRNEKTDLTIDFIDIGYAPEPLNEEFIKGANFKIALSYRVFR